MVNLKQIAILLNSVKKVCYGQEASHVHSGYTNHVTIIAMGIDEQLCLCESMCTSSQVIPEDVIRVVSGISIPLV